MWSSREYGDVDDDGEGDANIGVVCAGSRGWLVILDRRTRKTRSCKQKQPLFKGGQRGGRESKKESEREERAK